MLGARERNLETTYRAREVTYEQLYVYCYKLAGLFDYLNCTHYKRYGGECKTSNKDTLLFDKDYTRLYFAPQKYNAVSLENIQDEITQRKETLSRKTRDTQGISVDTFVSLYPASEDTLDFTAKVFGDIWYRAGINAGIFKSGRQQAWNQALKAYNNKIRWFGICVTRYEVTVNEYNMFGYLFVKEDQQVIPLEENFNRVAVKHRDIFNFFFHAYLLVHKDIEKLQKQKRRSQQQLSLILQQGLKRKSIERQKVESGREKKVGLSDIIDLTEEEEAEQKRKNISSSIIEEEQQPIGQIEDVPTTPVYEPPISFEEEIPSQATLVDTSSPSFSPPPLPTTERKIRKSFFRSTRPSSPRPPIVTPELATPVSRLPVLPPGFFRIRQKPLSPQIPQVVEEEGPTDIEEESIPVPEDEVKSTPLEEKLIPEIPENLIGATQQISEETPRASLSEIQSLLEPIQEATPIGVSSEQPISTESEREINPEFLVTPLEQIETPKTQEIKVLQEEDIIEPSTSTESLLKQLQLTPSQRIASFLINHRDKYFQEQEWKQPLEHITKLPGLKNTTVSQMIDISKRRMLKSLYDQAFWNRTIDKVLGIKKESLTEQQWQNRLPSKKQFRDKFEDISEGDYQDWTRPPIFQTVTVNLDNKTETKLFKSLLSKLRSPQWASYCYVTLEPRHFKEGSMCPDYQQYLFQATQNYRGQEGVTKESFLNALKNPNLILVLIYFYRKIKDRLTPILVGFALGMTPYNSKLAKETTDPTHRSRIQISRRASVRDQKQEEAFPELFGKIFAFCIDHATYENLPTMSYAARPALVLYDAMEKEFKTRGVKRIALDAGPVSERFWYNRGYRYNKCTDPNDFQSQQMCLDWEKVDMNTVETQEIEMFKCI